MLGGLQTFALPLGSSLATNTNMGHRATAGRSSTSSSSSSGGDGGSSSLEAAALVDATWWPRASDAACSPSMPCCCCRPVWRCSPCNPRLRARRAHECVQRPLSTSRGPDPPCTGRSAPSRRPSRPIATCVRPVWNRCWGPAASASGPRMHARSNTGALSQMTTCRRILVQYQYQCSARTATCLSPASVLLDPPPTVHRPTRRALSPLGTAERLPLPRTRHDLSRRG